MDNNIEKSLRILINGYKEGRFTEEEVITLIKGLAVEKQNGIYTLPVDPKPYTPNTNIPWLQPLYCTSTLQPLH